MSDSSLKNLIRQKAKDIGFSKIGFAEARQLSKHANHLRKWLSNGYHGTMGWMESNFEKRIDPRKVYPDAKTIIVVAINYFVNQHNIGDSGAAKISRYAWGDDYHSVLKERLRVLLNYIKSIDGKVEGKIYIDTGPVMEKAWAQISGIGWIGKHTNIITREYGSWVFLGVILLNKEIESDLYFTDHCGSCTKCIEACPTDAIVTPYILDSRLCISYLTIEHKDEIDSQLERKFENWIYGCDKCQDVCPWNKKFSKNTEIKEFHLRENVLNKNLNEFQSISFDEFNALFRGSPIKRIKHKKFIGNIRLIIKGKENDNKLL
ncbi:MAG: tRNA epoxyqueuosine(34) reductase QueG [Bacteroidota bacterium]|nr:tRNA epoxyqueuosine(34) reductase QueG [Bacteroidota bacterium]